MSKRVGNQKSSLKRMQNGSAQISEFGVAVVLLLSSLLLPMFVAARLFTAILLGQLVTDSAASSASRAVAFDGALQTAVSQIKVYERMLSLAQLKPSGGYRGSGIDLFVCSYKDKTGALLLSKANQPFSSYPLRVSTTADPIFQPDQPTTGFGNVLDNETDIRSGSNYSFRVKAQMNLPPLFGSAKNVRVPILTEPIILNFVADRFCEHQESATVILNCD